jgi:tetratricopeptide (TPR) repeat protein
LPRPTDSTPQRRRGVAAGAPRKDSVGADRHARFIGGCLAVTLSIVAYANAFNNTFVYDDYDTVIANPSLRDLGNIRFILVHSPFRPVVNVSYAIDRALWGYWAPGFHLTSVLLHAVVVGLLYAFILRALSDARVRVHGGTPDSRDPARLDAWTACVAATMFGVHPLMSEAVAYVSGRSELLVGMFFLAALLCGRAAMIAATHAPAGRRKIRVIRATTGTLIAGGLALCSKETGATLPIVLWLYDALILPSDSAARRFRLTRVFGPAFLLVAAAGILRYIFFPPPLSVSAATPGLTLLTQSIVLWRYLGLLLFPVNQSIMHGVHRVTSLVDPLALAAVAAMFLAGWVAFQLRRTAPLFAFGFLWFLVTMAPSSSVFALREGMAEHRAYLGSAAVLVALSRSGMRLFAALSRGRSGVPATCASGLVLLAALLTTLTLLRNKVWENPIALWAEAVEQSPGMWEPRYALADALRQAGACGAAIPHYNVVVRSRPAHRDAFTNLGICLAETGRLDEAEKAFTRALDIDPHFVRAYTNLGSLAILAGNNDLARDRYLEAIATDPQNVLARLQLARLYETVYQDYHSAARMCGEARAFAPRTPGVIECVERNQKLAAARDNGR